MEPNEAWQYSTLRNPDVIPPEGPSGLVLDFLGQRDSSGGTSMPNSDRK